MTKNEFIEKLLSERKLWDEQWKSIELSIQEKPVHDGEMSLRDILYHVAWYEREMIEVLQLRTLVGSPWWDLTQDERNANILTEGKSTSLLDAYREEKQVYSVLVGLLNELRDEELEDASFFRDMPPDWKPWELFADNTYVHYSQHFHDITG